MIYLIKSAGYDENENLIHLLKIGYTEDNNRDRRFMSYKLHNPTCKILYEIPSLSEDIEKRIQYKFRDYKYKEYGNEWFYYNDDVINFFRDIDKVDLESLPKNPVRGSKEFKKIKNECREVLSYFFNTKDTEEYLENIISKVKDQLSKDYVIEYLRKDPNVGNERVDKYFEVLRCRETGIYCEDDIVNHEVSEFLKVYTGLNTIYDKLKLLCEYGLSQDAIQIVLGQIADSDEIKSYYTTLGSQRLKGMGYHVTKIKRSLGIITFSQELLESSIYSEFKIGDKITLADIKLKLEYLYKSINYDAAPKAKDLENYFEVKNSSIYENGKKVKCYIIIKKKE
mgnify:CR=1 FL=1|jgi:hypothetical protein